MDPEERDLLLQFLWTRDFEDAIDTPEKLRGWLVGLSLLPEDEPVSEDDVKLARNLRAATRNLCSVNNGGSLDPRTHQVIERINELAPLKVTVGATGALGVQPGGSGVLTALSTFLAIGYKATVEGEFTRFKTCKACGYPFFDATKNGSRVWCAMGACGTRHKMRAYRARKASAEQ